jgi:hypothetical protein
MGYEIEVLCIKTEEHETKLKVRVPDSIASYSKEFNEYLDEMVPDIADVGGSDFIKIVDLRWSVVK